MSDYYPIFEVDPEPAFDPERIESMGSKKSSGVELKMRAAARTGCLNIPAKILVSTGRRRLRQKLPPVWIFPTQRSSLRFAKA